MFYDWFLTYVNDGIFVWFVLLTIASVIIGVTIASKSGRAIMGVTIGAILSLTFMIIALLTPKRSYFKHYYGKTRQPTEDQEKPRQPTEAQEKPLQKHKASKSFTYKELYNSDTATANGVENIPGDKEYANLGELASKLLQPIRDELGLPIVVNSGYRNPITNRLVGGKPTSAHLSGFAVDIKCPSYKDGDVKAFCKKVHEIIKKKNLKFDQLIFEYGDRSNKTKGWLHLGYKTRDGKSQRGDVISINKRGTFQGITY